MVEWKDPPPGETSPGKWDDDANELRANPGQWAIVRTANERKTLDTLGTTIRKGRATSWLPAKSFEAVVRSNGDGTYAVYARYIGDKEPL